jgi:hypothetical protein
MAMTKYLRKINLKEERFILAHGFRVFGPCVTGVLSQRPNAEDYNMSARQKSLFLHGHGVGDRLW